MLGKRGTEILARRRHIQMNSNVTRHPGSKRPGQGGYRAGAQHHRQATPYSGRAWEYRGGTRSKGNTWRAVTATYRSRPGWRKRRGSDRLAAMLRQRREAGS